MKSIDRRIAYYVRKVAELGRVRAHHQQPRKYSFRHDRLMAYKAAMHARIGRADQ